MAAKKIEKLTPKQSTQIDIYLREWMKIGTSTAPADRKTAEKAIVGLYAAINKKAPRFFWAQSPKHARQMIFEMTGERRASTSMWGQMDSYWVAFYEFCRSVIGVKYEKKWNEIFDYFKQLSESCGWIFPYENGCIVCERPLKIVMNDFGRLSCIDGPAVEFRDGWKTYCVDNNIVPEWVIMEPEKITPKLISNESNMETKRVMIQKYGLSKYLIETGAKVIDVDQIPVGGGVKNLDGSNAVIMRVLVKDDLGDAHLFTHDGGTPRVYDLNVENTAATCRAAHESISGFSDSLIKINA